MRTQEASASSSFAQTSPKGLQWTLSQRRVGRLLRQLGIAKAMGLESRAQLDVFVQGIEMDSHGAVLFGELAAGLFVQVRPLLTA